MERLVFGDDADALGLQAQGDDLALEIVADLLERTDVSHVTSPVVFRARDHRGLDGDLTGRGRSATHPLGPERSGGRRRGDFLASRGMGVSPGEESRMRRRCGSDDRGAAGLRPDQAIKEATCVRVLNRNLGRRRGVISVVLNKRSERFGRRERNNVREMAASSAERTAQRRNASPRSVWAGPRSARLWSMHSRGGLRLLAQARRSLVQRADLREPVRRRR